MPRINEVKRGAVIDLDGDPWIVRDVDVRSPTARGASTLYKMKLSNPRSGQNQDRTFKGDEFVKEADFARRAVQFLYSDGDEYTFMDTEDYNQFGLGSAELGDAVKWLSDGLEGITALLVDGAAVAIDLPQSITAPIEETSPAIKGASASARTKPARLPSGVEVQVPEYLEVGERIKVNTETGKFMSRATD